jgi:PAS domain S-box-containing protein
MEQQSVPGIDDICGALGAKLEMAEKVLAHCNYNLQLTIQIWIRATENIEPLLAKRADNSAEIARLIGQIREQADSEEERQLVDAASPRWTFSEYYGELLRQIVDGESCAEAGAESSSVFLPLLLDQASWKAFVEFLRAKSRTVDLTDEARERMIARTRELVRQNQVLKSVVAERKRLHERLSQLASIIEGANDAIVVYTLGGTIVSWNAGAERLYGYASSEVLGRSRYMLAAPDQPDELAGMSDKLRREEAIPLCEAVHIRKGGKRMGVCMSLSPVREVNGELVGFAAITREVSDASSVPRSKNGR